MACRTTISQTGADYQIDFDFVLPSPSPVIGPSPWPLKNLRWKSWRPRRTARNGSRAMIKQRGIERPVVATSCANLLGK